VFRTTRAIEGHVPGDDMLNQTSKRRRVLSRLLSLAGVAVAALMLLTFARAPVAQEGAVSASSLAASLSTRLDALDPQVRYLKDRKDIFDVLKRYTRGADRHDKDLVRGAFWPEATISFGTQMTRDQYADWEENELAGYAAHQHHITGQTIDIDGDTAHVESYVLEELGARMLRDDPKVRAEFEKALEDPGFASDPKRRLDFIYERSPYRDDRKGLVPIVRVDAF